jgi:hypothetical protein
MRQIFYSNPPQAFDTDFGYETPFNAHFVTYELQGFSGECVIRKIRGETIFISSLEASSPNLSQFPLGSGIVCVLESHTSKALIGNWSGKTTLRAAYSQEKVPTGAIGYSLEYL